jgi:thymidine phosphorylase
MTSALGGPADFIQRPAHYLPAAPVVREVESEGEGTVAAIDTRAIGIAVVELGGGRMRASDTIDHAVGFTRLAGLGTAVGKGTPLGRVHARDAAAADRAAASLRAAYRLGANPPQSRTVYEWIGA